MLIRCYSKILGALVLKSTFSLFTLFLIWCTIQLPTGSTDLNLEERKQIHSYHELPQFDYQQAAELLQHNQDLIDSLGTLNIGLAISEPANKPNIIQERQQYLAGAIKQNPLFVEAHGYENFALYFKDLVDSPLVSPYKQIVENPLLLKILPNAVDVAQLFQYAQNHNLIDANIVTELRVSWSSFVAEPKAATLVQVRNTLLQVYNIALESHNYVEFAQLAQSAQSSNQLKVVLFFLKSPQRDVFIHAISLAKLKVGLTESTLSYLNEYGEQGLMNIQYAFSKGVKGMEFVILHPSLPVALNTPGSSTIPGISEVNYHFMLLNTKTPFLATTARVILLSVLFTFLAFFFTPQSLNPIWQYNKNNNKKGYNYMRFASVFSCGLGLSAFLTFTPLLLKGSDVPMNQVSSLSGGTAASTIGQSQPPATDMASGYGFAIGGLILLILLICQILIAVTAKSKVESLSKDEGFSAKRKLQLVENMETLFDLPLYLGLAGTIIYFTIFTLFPDSGKILAYLSTLFGVIITAVIKLKIVAPFRQKLIEQTPEESV